MGLFNNFPYTDFHRLNLDWILKFTKSVRDRLDLIDAAVVDAQSARDRAEAAQTDAESARDIAMQAASNAEDFKNSAEAAADGAAASASDAIDAKDAAEAAQTAAEASQTAAAGSATAAGQSATAAAGSATAAGQSATAAAGSATTAGQSATAAQTAQTAAEAAQTAAETAAASVPSLEQTARRSNYTSTPKLTVRSSYTTGSGFVLNTPGLVVMKMPYDAWRSGMTPQDIGDYWHVNEGFNFMPIKALFSGAYPDGAGTLDGDPNIIALYFPRWDFIRDGNNNITHVTIYAIMYDVHNATYPQDGETVHLEVMVNAYDMEHSLNTVIVDG